MAISQIVYTSKVTVEFDRLRLVSLLNKARAYNAQKSITGVLLHSHGMFTQCLEGETNEVDPLYQRICQDKRHDDVVLMQSLVLPQRNFSEWMMGCVEVHDSELLEVQNAHWQEMANINDEQNWLSPGFVLMKSLWDMHQDNAL